MKINSDLHSYVGASINYTTSLEKREDARKYIQMYGKCIHSIINIIYFLSSIFLVITKPKPIALSNVN